MYYGVVERCGALVRQAMCLHGRITTCSESELCTFYEVGLFVLTLSNKSPAPGKKNPNKQTNKKQTNKHPNKNKNKNKTKQNKTQKPAI